MTAQPEGSPGLRRIGAGEPEYVALAEGHVWRLGRGKTNDIILNDNMVSRNHAMIQSDGSEFLLIDLGSLNGVAVNERRVSVPVALRSGDQVSIGQARFTFEQPHSPEPASPVAEDMLDSGVETRVMVSHRKITVLVLDIRDFTGLSQRVSEETMARAIGTWIRETGSLLAAAGAWGQKYIGDAIMAVWVHDEQHDDSAVINRAIEALTRVLAVTQRLRSDFQLPTDIRVGAGINTSLASLGNMGSGAFADHTALGDGVNKAFRLEAASKQIGKDLVLGQETYDALCASAAVGPLFGQYSVELKGYTERHTVYAVSFDALPGVVAALQRD